MQTRILRALPVALLVVAGPVLAQGTPTEAPAADAVTLAFKYKIGEAQRFKGVAKSDFSLTPEGGAGGGAGGLGPIPISVRADFTAQEKIAGTRQGTATINVAVPAVTMNTNVFGTEVVIKSVGGKITTLVNGQVQQPGAGTMPGLDPNMLKSITAPFTIKRDPRGTSSGEGNSSSVFGGATMAIVELPDKPVRVGDTWETSRKQKLAMAGPLAAAAGGGLPELTINFTHTLKALEKKGGKTFAIIESTGAAQTDPAAGGAPAAPGGAAGGPSLQQDMSGTTRFDVARGAIVGGRFTMTFGSKINAALPGGAGGGGAAGGGGMRIDGTVETTLNELPATGATAKKKPVKKRK